VIHFYKVDSNAFFIEKCSVTDITGSVMDIYGHSVNWILKLQIRNWIFGLICLFVYLSLKFHFFFLKTTSKEFAVQALARYRDNGFQSSVFPPKSLILDLVPEWVGTCEAKNKRLCMGIFLYSTIHIKAVLLSNDFKFSVSL
jgi:hypothetical protein